jgi:hypothetical protein
MQYNLNTSAPDIIVMINVMIATCRLQRGKKNVGSRTGYTKASTA